jgi:hypothetical protein
MLKERGVRCARRGIFGLVSLSLAVSRLGALDLSNAALSLPTNPSKVELKAATMLNDEVAKRTQIRLARTSSSQVPLICPGTVKSFHASVLNLNPKKLEGLDAPESFRIWIEPSGEQPRVIIAGADDRGVLFGVGYFLRKAELAKQKISVPDDFHAASAPKMKLRGHQLGYRQKTNSYDGWDVGLWEQYLRDLAIFGCNNIELIPPRSDDEPESPHFPLPPMEMMIEMSRLSDEYGMDVWIWYPAMDRDYSDEKTVEFALKEWADVFRQLPRVDAVFVPGGDPGHTQPKYLFNLLEKQTDNLHRFHPHATMWVSPQSFGSEWLDEFFQLMQKEPAWLTGVAYGPQVRIPLADLRARIPARYPIRDYPDITHSRHCQYPVPNWDLAYALTEGREAINPRPTQMANIFRKTTFGNSIGFITYSEGCNDDVNKAVWSALGWDPDADINEVLRDYSRYFIGSDITDTFADLLRGLEQNWTGAVETNSLIEPHLQLARDLEAHATPRQKLNWRFQQALYRAYYDAFIQRRLRFETKLEQDALAQLQLASSRGVLAATDAAETILKQATDKPVAQDLRSRLFELAEALFQSIRMQLSTERFLGEEGRGSNLNEIDRPLNNRLWLEQQFQRIAALDSEKKRLSEIEKILNSRDPGPGNFYDDLGDPRHQPHLLTGAGWENDPGFFHTPQIGFTDLKAGNQPLPLSWWHSVENLYDEPLRMRYTDLDKTARYKLRLVYGKYRNNAPIRLVANHNIEIHSGLNRPAEPLEFDLPAEATSDGVLALTWFPTTGRGGNGRVLDIAEVWLLKKTE